QKIKLHKERIPLSGVVETALESCRSIIEANGHRLAVNVPAEPIYLDADAVRISQVLVNLLNNAAKYTKPGGQIWLSEEAANVDPEVLVVDIGLPGMNGYEVARHIRQQPRLRKAVLVPQTGWGQEEDRRRSYEAGFDHHFVKPVSPQALEELLRTLPGK